MCNFKIKINGNKNIPHDKIKGRLGLTDKLNQSVFFLEGGAFITPHIDYNDFNVIMSEIESNCRKSLKSKLLTNTFLSPDFLMNFEICSDRMEKGKRSYLSFQYHFKQKNNQNESVVTLKENNELFFIDLLNDIETNLMVFDIHPSRKR